MTSSCRCARVSASSAPKGSSSSSTLGLIASARAIPTRCFMPPEISAGTLLHRMRHVHELEIAQRPLVALGLGLAAREHLVDGQPHVVVHREPRQQRVVLEHHGTIGPGLMHLAAFEEHVAAGGVGEPGDDVEQRRFAAARMADDGDVFALAPRPARCRAALRCACRPCRRSCRRARSSDIRSSPSYAHRSASDQFAASRRPGGPAGIR